MTTAAAATENRVNYLNADYGVKSWLLTTDHKRIAILYLISITMFFLLVPALTRAMIGLRHCTVLQW